MKLNKQDLIDCCQAALNCYKNSKFFKEKKCIYKEVFDETEDFTVDTVQGYFGYKKEFPKRLWIVFRGSEEDEKDNADWKTNFAFQQITFKTRTKVKVHAGFLRYYKKVKPKIIAKCNQYDEIIITGHSLGSALATLCAENIKFLFLDKDVTCVPLSSPRVGNSLFCKSYEMRIDDSYRIWCGQDTVVRVPMWIMGYRHVKGGKWLPRRAWYNPLRWILSIFSWPHDHWPQELLKEMQKQL